MSGGYILLDQDNVVIQKQPHIQEFEAERGFLWINDALYESVVCGMIKTNDGFIPPPS